LVIGKNQENFTKNLNAIVKMPLMRLPTDENAHLEAGWPVESVCPFAGSNWTYAPQAHKIHF